MIRQLTIRRPDDWHVHLREGELLRAVLPCHAQQYQRFVAMPNLQQPLVSRELARAYRAEIHALLPENSCSEPLIPCYLTEETRPEEVIEGHKAGDFFGAKFYPVGATTQSHAGVADIRKLYPLFEQMQKHKVPLLMHGEVVDPAVDIYDRERVFVETSLDNLLRHFPEMIMTMEHLSSKEAVDFIADHQKNSHLAGSITLHHMMLSRDDMLSEGLRADYFCYPLLKTAKDGEAVRKAALSGQECYFLGTDSAPHVREQKYCAEARAGIFSAPYSLSGYLRLFDEGDALENFEAFASLNGAKHYRMPVNSESVTFEKQNRVTEFPVTQSTTGSIRNFQPNSAWTQVA